MSREILGVLEACRLIAESAWNDVLPGLAAGPPRWATASDHELSLEMDGYLRQAAEPPREVRIFWKFGDQLRYAGANVPFALDAGFTAPEEMIGFTDFDPPVPWTRQAAKYQADDRDVMASNSPRLFILERQQREDGVFWLHTGKAPIRAVNGGVVGILGMYETIDQAQAMEIRRRTGQI